MNTMQIKLILDELHEVEDLLKNGLTAEALEKVTTMANVINENVTVEEEF